MTNIEDELKNIKFRGLDVSERDTLWRGILDKWSVQQSSLLFNFALKPMTALIIALVVLFGGSGVVVASDVAKPGDALFGIDLAIERVRLSLAKEDNRNELARTFAQERLEEIQGLRDDDSDDDKPSTAGLTEAEAEVFTNETVVKLEINNRKVGFLTQTKVRAALVDEIVAQYDLEKATVETVLVVETEDRASRPEDKKFLNSEVHATGDISLDDDEKHDIEVSLNQVLKILEEDNATSSVELRTALRGILESSITGKIKIESDDQKVEFKFKDGSIEMKVKNEDDSDEDSEDDSDEEDNRGQGNNDDDRFKVHLSGSVVADDADDDDEEGVADDDSDEDSDNDSDDDSDEDDEEEDNSGSGRGSDDDDDEDEDEVDIKIKL